MADSAIQYAQLTGERAQQFGSSLKQAADTKASFRRNWPWSRILKWIGIVVALAALAVSAVIGGGIFLAVATVSAPIWLPLPLFVGLPLFLVFGVPTIAFVAVIGGGVSTIVVGGLGMLVALAWLILYIRKRHPPGSQMVDSAVSQSLESIGKLRDRGKGIMTNWRP